VQLAAPERPGLRERLAGLALTLGGGVGMLLGRSTVIDVGTTLLYGGMIAAVGVVLLFVGWRKKREARRYAAFQPEQVDAATVAVLDDALDGAPATEEAAIALLGHKDVRVRLAAATHLAAVATPAAAAALKKASRSPLEHDLVKLTSKAGLDAMANAESGALSVAGAEPQEGRLSAVAKAQGELEFA